MPFCVFNQNGITILNEINTIISMNINFKSMIFISNNDELYVKGDNTAYQLGMNTRKERFNVLAKNGFHNDVALVSNGFNNRHAFIYTNDDRLYGYGGNWDMQLGYFTSKTEVLTSKMIGYNFDSKIIQIECSKTFSLFLTLNGLVYGCGRNDNGNLLTRKHSFRNGITCFDILKQYKIVQIMVSERTSFVLDSNGVMYSFGANNSGELGIGMKELKRFNIVTNNAMIMSCGLYHVGFITNNYDLYMFGNNGFGQTGVNNEYKFINKPTRLYGKYSDLKCGGNHTIIKRNDNEFYGFGFNKNYRCLVKSKSNNILKPTKICIDSIKTKIGSNNDIIGFIPSGYDTYILQRYHVKSSKKCVIM